MFVNKSSYFDRDNNELKIQDELQCSVATWEKERYIIMSNKKISRDEVKRPQLLAIFT